MAKIKSIRLFALLLCVLIIPIFAGCTLVTTNVDKYLNEVAMSYDNGRVTVTREELISTYNSIGNSRFDDSSTPTKEGIESTLDLALNREILVDFLTANDMAEQREALKIQKVELTTFQQNEVWQKVYDYVNDSVESYEKDLRQEDDAMLPSGTTDEEAESLYEDALYDKTYILVEDNDGNFVLQKVAKDVEVSNKSIALFNVDGGLSFSEKAEIAYETFRKNYWHWTDSILMNENATNKTSYSDRAWSKFINQLLRNEVDRNLSKTSEDAFLRQIEKVYDVYYQNAVLTVFQERYEDSVNVTSNMVYQKYKELYDAQVEKYTTDSSAFHSAVPTSAQNVYYMQDTTGYFKVNHILIKFSDEQNSRIEAEKKKLTNLEIDKATYEQNVAIIKSETKAQNGATLSAVYNEITSALNSAGTESAKMSAFATLMHKYSEDTATLGGEACYYIPLDSSKDSMEKAFADNSRELYNLGKGKVGDISAQWIETSYGYHVIMYTGTPTNVEATGNINTLITSLDAYRLNPLYNKTMLDKIIESVTLSSYSDYENNILTTIKKDKSLTKNEKVYSDLYA